jgi:hypothetical protein
MRADVVRAALGPASIAASSSLPSAGCCCVLGNFGQVRPLVAAARRAILGRLAALSDASPAAGLLSSRLQRRLTSSLLSLIFALL